MLFAATQIAVPIQESLAVAQQLGVSKSTSLAAKEGDWTKEIVAVVGHLLQLGQPQIVYAKQAIRIRKNAYQKWTCFAPIRTLGLQGMTIFATGELLILV
jgi:hypothetical protein